MILNDLLSQVVEFCVLFAHVAIDHSHSQQPMPRGFPLFKRCEWSIATWTNGRHLILRVRHFMGYNRRCLKNYGFILKNDGNFQKFDAPPPTKTRFNRMMFASKPNKLSQEQNSYFISF